MTVTSAKRKSSSASISTDTGIKLATACYLISWPAGRIVENVGIRYSCDYCYKDISSIVRIQCAECGLAPPPPEADDAATAAAATDEPTALKVSSSYNLSAALEEVDLCVECFAAGVEFGRHKRSHAYRILKPLDFAIYREEWRADEEMLLLEAVESNGVGNWQDVAEQLATRTPQECKAHYTEVYLETRGGAPLVLSPEAVARSAAVLRGQKLKRPKLVSSEETLSLHPTPQSVPANHEITGFMPLRGEFETEFENDAELAIKDLQFTEEDTPAERQTKFAMLDIYTMVLERRVSRHAFIFSHALQDFRRHQAVDKSRSKEERELYNGLKPFARFLAADDFQSLLEGLVREEELRRQIAHLQELRRNGIRAFGEVPAFEAERKHLELYLKGGAPPTSIMATAVSGGAAAGGAATITSRAKEPFPLPSMTAFIKSSSSQSQQQHQHDGSSAAQNGASLTAAPTVATTVTTVSASNAPATISIPRSVYPDDGVAAMHNSPSPSAYSPLGTPSSTTPIPAGGPTVAPASSGGRKASTPLNISHAEGVELLSEKERHLCSILRLYPRLYLSIKDTLIREYLKLGGLKRAQARAAVKIDVNKTSKLYDFFVAAGWIKPPASGE